MMPKMNGSEVYKEILKINPSVKVIFSSGYSDADDHNLEIDVKNENTTLMNKPFDIKTLTEKVNSML